MNKLILLSALVILSFASQAQFIEFGGGIGVSNYTGDLNSYPRIGHSHLAGTGIYRLNFSHIVSVKFALTAGKISGDDSHPVDALGEQRQYTFEHSFFELSSVFEYHFLDYRSDNLRQKWAPYIFLGFGITRLGNTQPAYEDYNRFQAVIPMGAGVKYTLSKRLTLGLEAGARKTFFDYLDGLSDGDQTIKQNWQFANPNDQDWYFYTGISLTYVLYEVPCPFPYVPNKSIFTRIRPH